MQLIETVSTKKPVKLIGEWVNEEEHPRDSNDGILMMKVRKYKVRMHSNVFINDLYLTIEFLVGILIPREKVCS